MLRSGHVKPLLHTIVRTIYFYADSRARDLGLSLIFKQNQAGQTEFNGNSNFSKSRPTDQSQCWHNKQSKNLLTITEPALAHSLTYLLYVSCHKDVYCIIIWHHDMTPGFQKKKVKLLLTHVILCRLKFLVTRTVILLVS